MSGIIDSLLVGDAACPTLVPDMQRVYRVFVPLPNPWHCRAERVINYHTICIYSVPGFVALIAEAGCFRLGGGGGGGG